MSIYNVKPISLADEQEYLINQSDKASNAQQVARNLLNEFIDKEKSDKNKAFEDANTALMATQLGMNPNTSREIVIAEMISRALNPDLQKQVRIYNSKDTPIIRQTRFQTPQIPNTPFYDETIAELYKGPLGSQSAYKHEQYQNLINHINQQYGAQNTSLATENHMQTARKIVEESLQQKKLASERLDAMVQTQLELAKQIKISAEKNGMPEKVATQYAHEMSSAFVIGQQYNNAAYPNNPIYRDTYKYLIESHKKSQEVALYGQKDPKTLTDTPLHAPGVQNVDDDVKRKLDLQRKINQQSNDPKQFKTNYAEINVADEKGIPVDHHTAIGALGAATNQASDITGMQLRVVENYKGINAHGSAPRGASTPGQTPLITNPGVIPGIEKHELERPQQHSFEHPFLPKTPNKN